MEVLKLGKDRTLTLPEDLCALLKMEEGDPFAISVKDGYMEISSVIEIYTPERIAEFHLNNALDEEGYRWAVKEVLSMGIDPLKLNPDHVFYNDQPWRRPELYMDSDETLPLP